MKSVSACLFAICFGLALVAMACSGGGADGGTSDSGGVDGATTGSGDTGGNAPGGDSAGVSPQADADEADAPSGPIEDVTHGPPDAPSPQGDADSEEKETTAPVDEPFSFFVTSLEAMQELSGSVDGFGGNLGGLEGADEICQTIAGTVDGGHKVWRAFLSATVGPDGEPVHAIDRVGDGPWYDRNGRLVAMNKEELITERPTGDPQIVEDLPNEYGQGQKQFGDNHDTLTGTNASGMLNSTDPLTTCMDWQCPGSAFCPEDIEFEKTVMGGHSWPRDDNAGGGGQGPPFLLTACEGKSEGEACVATGNQGSFQSTCEVIDDAGTLSCSAIVPPPWFFACSGKAEGEACEVTKGPNKFSGTCGVLEETPSLACLPEGFDPATDIAA
ncbi:MAG: hypothetical protein QF464_10475, partial [Myxococcota bacterium]|nr:hypothetical protein [Myxococcota bacterium]